MGYTQDKPLESLFPIGPAERAAERMAGRSNERIHDVAAELTPVADVPEGMTSDMFSGSRGRTPGTAKRSWRTTEVERAAETFSAETYTEDPVMPHIEYDTRPHIIRPRPDRAPASVASTGHLRKAGTDPRARLRYYQGGREVFAAEVHHPGTKGKHMMRDALAETDATWADTIGEEELAAWMRETEAEGG